MKRRSEKISLYLGASWNIFTSILTIFGYSKWFKNEGILAFEKANQVDYFSTSLIESLVNIIMVFGLFMLMIGIVNFFVAHSMNKEIYNKKVFMWLLFCIVIQFLSFDIVGILLYLVTATLYMARKKAYKLSLQ